MPRTKVVDERVRITLAVSPTIKDRLDDLQDRTEAESMTETFRRALAIYEAMVDAKERGAKVIVKEKNGRTRDLLIL